MKRTITSAALLLALATPAHAADRSFGFAQDRPWVSDVFFYWYTWDYDRELGGWMGGVHNTPLYGYYDSRTFKDNYHSLWLAEEWGMTHHFMDYWAPNWIGENGEMRERTVLRAAEQLRKQGYPIWMGYYQDGENFAMREFSRNVSEKRDVYQWLRDFAPSPAWTRMNGKPFQLVYSRNGSPQTTIDHEGFRRWLQQRYGSLSKLNADWGTSFASFDDITMDFSATGYQRAFSIFYQEEIWRREWEKLEGLVKQELNLPGVLASFDVGYAPYHGFGYAPYARTFGGPHSYAGIFDVPFAQDAERFIQTAVAKRYNTVFFDHLKNNYHDWNIRHPGTAYLPEPFTYHRCWVGNLMRYAAGVLHLSWNEWWEGSNLEPSREFGKTHCEQNLFYSTLMQTCFDSIKNWSKGAQVGVILNDWIFLSGAGRAEDLYAPIQALRQLNVPFDLIPEDFVTDAELSKFRVVIAPAGAVGFGYNAQGERISDVLFRWVQSDSKRKFITSIHDDATRRLALQPVTSDQSPVTRPGADLNVFIDVGVEGDDEFLLDGFSGREDWGKLPEGAFGADTNLTVRWTPAVGKVTTLFVPLSPNREHILRVSGRAIWENKVTVELEGKAVGAFEVKPGLTEYEVRLSADAIGDRTSGELRLVYAVANVPREKDPQRFPGEARVCNLGIDWIQVSTSNIPARTHTQKFTRPKSEIVLDDAVFGALRNKRLPASNLRRQSFADAGRVLSRYADRLPRDLLMLRGGARGGGEVLYVNGLFSDDARWWDAVLTGWAKMPPLRLVNGSMGQWVNSNVMSARLQAGDTDILLVENRDLTKAQKLMLQLPKRDVPVSEVVALSRDGQWYQPVKNPQPVTRNPQFNDVVRYYTVYQVAFSPVRCITPSMVLHPEETKTFAFTLENLTDKPQSGEVQVQAVIPSIQSQAVKFSLPPRAKQKVNVSVTATALADWGRKTVVVRLTAGKRTAYLWRELKVERNPELVVETSMLNAQNPVLVLRNKENGYIGNDTARKVRVVANNATVSVGDVRSGASATVKLPVPPPYFLNEQKLLVKWTDGRGERETTLTVPVAHLPRQPRRAANATNIVAVFNPSQRWLDHQPLSVKVGAGVSARPRRAGTEAPPLLCTPEGNPVPCQVDGNTLWFSALVPPKGSQILHLSSGASPKTDLTVTKKGGVVTVENSRYLITFDESRGGTVTRFVSKATGRDYGAESFGVTYGQFSVFDPRKPAVDTAQFINEKRVRQSDGRGKVEVLANGPVMAVVKVTFEDARVKAQQVYRLFAHTDTFEIITTVIPKSLKGVQELVALDARFQPHRLAKIYPNFVGIRGEETNQVHYGWRRGNWVPDYITLMNPQGFDESISIVPFPSRDGDGATRRVNHVRQGFYPEQRGKPGALKYAEVEIVTLFSDEQRRPQGAMLRSPRNTQYAIRLRCFVKLHAGHQVVAKALLEDLTRPPLVLVQQGNGAPRSALRPPQLPGDWWDPYWQARLKVEATPSVSGTSVVRLRLKDAVQGVIEPSSLRVVRVRGRAVVPANYDRHAGELFWFTDKAEMFHVYFDFAGSALKPPPSGAAVVLPTAISEDFEDLQQHAWELSGSSLAPHQGRSGNALRLKVEAEGQPSLATCQGIASVPNATYNVRFWAKVVQGPAAVRLNFYAGASYDFNQIVVNLNDDGAWHEYHAAVPTGAFPPEVKPNFRIWALNATQEILVDDLRLELSPSSKPAEASVQVGTLEVAGGKLTANPYGKQERTRCPPEMNSKRMSCFGAL